MMSASPRLALKGYTEQELVAEARLRNSYNRQARILKKVLQDSRIPGEDTVSAIDLRYAAERTKLQVPAKFLSSPRVSWRTVISDMKPPALVGHGNFTKLPMLRAQKMHQAAEQETLATMNATPAADHLESMPPASHVSAVKDREAAEIFARLVMKIKERFTELRRAFRLLDEDHDGFLSHEELKRILTMFNMDNVPEYIVDRIIRLIDRNNDGTVTFDEFSRLVSIENPREEFALMSQASA